MSEPEADPMLDEDIELDELLPWIEFGCWTAIALFPFLCWVNGPAVSTDQFVMRSILIGVSVVGALGLRFRNWRANQQADSCGQGGATADAGTSQQEGTV